MSRTGASGGYLTGTTQVPSPFNATWAFHMWVKGPAVPGTASFQRVINVQNTSGGTQAVDYGFNWSHMTGSFEQAVQNRRAGTGVYDAAQLTTPLQADTWYAIGGSFDGTTLRAYLNGVLEASVASAAPGTNNANVSLLAEPGGTSKFTGTIAEVCLWGGKVPTADMFKALATGMTPEMIVPVGWQASYWPIHGFMSPEGEYSTTVPHRSLTLNGTLPRADEPPITPTLARGPRW